MENSLHERYLKSRLPNRFPVAQVCRILTDKFRAEEMDKDWFADLKKDPLVHDERIAKCFKIVDDSVLQSLFSPEERQMHRDSAASFRNDRLHGERERIWKDLQEGKRLHVVLETVDGESLSGFTLQGISQKLLAELVVLQGIDPARAIPGTLPYERYLQFAAEAGYL